MMKYITDNFKYIAPITIILYVLGYIVIMANIAQYGFTPSEVINTKYISAGFYLFVAIIIQMILINYFLKNEYKFSDLAKMGNPSNVGQRIWLWLIILIALTAGSFIMSRILKLGESRQLGSVELSIIYQSPLDFDLLGKFVESQYQFINDNELIISLQVATLISGYLLFFIALVYLAKFAIKLVLKIKSSGFTAYSKPYFYTISSNGRRYASTTLLIIVEVLLISIFAATTIVGVMHLFSSEMRSFDVKISDYAIYGWNILVLLTIAMVLNHFKSVDFKGRLLNVNSLDLFNIAVIPLLFEAFLFGKYIYPKIPITFGGGAAMEVSVASESLPDKFNGLKSYLIFESNGRYFICFTDNGDVVSTIAIESSKLDYIEAISNN